MEGKLSVITNLNNTTVESMLEYKNSKNGNNVNMWIDETIDSLVEGVISKDSKNSEDSIGDKVLALVVEIHKPKQSEIKESSSVPYISVKKYDDLIDIIKNCGITTFFFFENKSVLEVFDDLTDDYDIIEIKKEAQTKEKFVISDCMVFLEGKVDEFIKDPNKKFRIMGRYNGSENESVLKILDSFDPKTSLSLSYIKFIL